MNVTFTHVDSITVDVPEEHITREVEGVSVLVGHDSPAFDRQYIRPNGGSLLSTDGQEWLVYSVGFSHEGVLLTALEKDVFLSRMQENFG